MNYELIDKLCELKSSGVLNDADIFFKGYTGEFDLFIEINDNYDISMIRSNRGIRIYIRNIFGYG